MESSISNPLPTTSHTVPHQVSLATSTSKDQSGQASLPVITGINRKSVHSMRSVVGMAHSSQNKSKSIRSFRSVPSHVKYQSSSDIRSTGIIAKSKSSIATKSSPSSISQPSHLSNRKAPVDSTLDDDIQSMVDDVPKDETECLLKTDTVRVHGV